MSVRNALCDFLDAVKNITAADAVTLFFETDAVQPSLLFHAGEAPPVAELESRQQAREFCSKTGKESLDESAGSAAFYCFPSRMENGYLLCLDIAQARTMLAPAVPAQNLKRTTDAEDKTARPERLWLGWRYLKPASFPGIGKFTRPSVGFSLQAPGSSEDWFFWNLALGGKMAWEIHRQSLLPLDSVTHLPGRVEFQAFLNHEHGKSIRENLALGLLLINPDDFGAVNHRLGKQGGDRVLREIASQLSVGLRQTDYVFRYGSAIFAVVIPGATRTAIEKVADKLRLGLEKTAYTAATGAIHLSFSLGGAVHEASDVWGDQTFGSLRLLRRADQALNAAKISGGACTVIWDPESMESGIGHLDRLSGIFTADTEKDYRNMQLLWETITVISSSAETEVIAGELVKRIGETVKPQQVALFLNEEGKARQLLAVSRSTVVPGAPDENTPLLSDEKQRLIDEADEHRQIQVLHLSEARRGEGNIAYAIPLLSRSDCLGILYLDGLEDTLRLDTSDLVFLDALASQIGMLLDRALLASRWKEEKLRESRRLRQEVQELRQLKRHGQLIYHSRSMEAVVSMLEKVAPTDVTVLITGESGTGKDKLARAVHELSNRKGKPFVTVDCGAIAHSLIDTELFGHLKGAYTGAQNAASGRIFQAKGGTLFLDEIGELPLETQAKLLRLIQEKEITPVGAAKPLKIDVRIVAATNRDLANEVAEGLFRQDLYYRLQVVSVAAPPLRERPEDILPLARYFLGQFVADYGKTGLYLNATAEKALLDYRWPGNVRELQNRLLQAVITSENLEIGREGLHLPESTALSDLATENTAAATSLSLQADDSLEDVYSRHLRELEHSSLEVVAPTNIVDDLPWETLSQQLRQQILRVQQGAGVPVPLGKWLEDDLVLAAGEVSGNVARRASSVLGMPETTYRRRLEKVKREQEAGLAMRNAEWNAVPDILSRLVSENKDAPEQKKLFDEVRGLLLEEVMTLVPQNASLGAALMGITVLTYRRWTASCQREAV
ncbi:sigma 54-interacting transcriptional regulator [Thiolapillus sp.]